LLSAASFERVRSYAGKESQLKDKFITVIKAVISLGLMGYLFYRFLSNPIDRTVLINSLTQANYWYLLLALALFVFAIFTNAVKWQVLLKAQGIPVPIGPLTNYTFMGVFFNNFLPANVGGDVIRGVGLARYTERSAAAAVSVVVDRIMGLLGYMFSAVIAALIAVNIMTRGWLGTESVDETLLQNLAKVQVVAVLGLIAILLVFAILLSQRLRKFFGRVFSFGPLKPLAPIYQQVSTAFGAYRYQYRALFIAFLIGVSNIILTSLVDIAILTSLGADVAPIYVFLFNPIIAVILIAPISIGGLGTMSVLYVYFYGLVGVPAALAFALSLIKQAIIYLGSLPGAFFWMRGRQSRENAELQQERNEPESLADVPAR
jgi:uncharacterized protein (TIRG00374 family)